MVTFEFQATLWEATSTSSWVFLSLPTDVTDEIRERSTRPRRGFGSIPVAVSIGDTSWTTSIFPDGKRNSYVLPVKKAVRTQQELAVGDTAAIVLSLEP
ncbi:DUF1905 domain-containing protein [Cryobacterium luteum]|uniref:DUF1905 domain-containing protein n=1 Tax=Cryobacterium luteum TaxID=1424661 RepID=A0A1H8FII5_9MICO|nr:DUF1905 domain-containing protein [Cryobacterium luteum]TFB93359.1 DUF1905 domain-containing protein [Cryobacterium luteum]SEN30878.1 protein of unknown function [Cryobacterium luteum]